MHSCILMVCVRAFLCISVCVCVCVCVFKGPLKRFNASDGDDEMEDTLVSLSNHGAQLGAHTLLASVRACVRVRLCVCVRARV